VNGRPRQVELGVYRILNTQWGTRPEAPSCPRDDATHLWTYWVGFDVRRGVACAAGLPGLLSDCRRLEQTD
jgi:hypothetical protein